MFRTISGRLFSRAKLVDIESLSITEHMKTSLRSMGISRLTPVQAESFPQIAAGQSCVAVAKTGEGKTLAYLIPVLARLTDERVLSGSQSTACLIAVPTRELCQQVASTLVALCPTTNILLAYGKPGKAFRTMLHQRPPVIIGTGGRLASLIKKGEVNPKSVKVVVVDELDSLLIDDYRKEIAPLIGSMHSTTQFIGMGATMSPELEKVLDTFPPLSAATRLNTLLGHKQKTPTTITHESVKVSDSLPLRISSLAALIETLKFKQAIVFASTTAEARAISQHPTLLGRSRALHGKLNQMERELIMNRFRSGKIDILVCTDVAARGLDVADVDLVVSFRPPSDDAQYIHRAGRTGRSGRRGTSIVMYSTSERSSVEQIGVGCGISFERRACPSPTDMRRILVDSIFDQARTQFSPTENLVEFIKNLSEKEREKLTGLCLYGLIGEKTGLDVSRPERSILSGESGMTPIMFMDPGKALVKSRADVSRILEELSVPSVGMVAFSESGYITDIPTETALTLCGSRADEVREKYALDVVILDKLPNIRAEGLARGKKVAGVLPWRRNRTKK